MVSLRMEPATKVGVYIPRNMSSHNLECRVVSPRGICTMYIHVRNIELIYVQFACPASTGVATR